MSDWYEARVLKFNKNGTGGGQLVIGGKGPGMTLEQLLTRKRFDRVPEFRLDSVTRFLL